MTRLYARLYLHFLVLLAAAWIVGWLTWSAGVRPALARGWAERLANHAAWVVGDRWSDSAARARVVRRLADELDIDLTLRDRAGRSLFVAGVELPAVDGSEARAVEDGPLFMRRRRHWFIAAPIRDRDGRLVGTIAGAPARRWQPPSVLRPTLAALAVLLVVALVTLPLARRLSRPVERLTEAMRRFGAGDLGHRIAVPGRCHPDGRRRRTDELLELSHHWNEMAERIESLVKGQKELLANVSHELRSPLARIRVALDLLPGSPDGDARRRDILTDVDELDRLIEDVLGLARLDAGALPLRPRPLTATELFAEIATRAASDPTTAGTEIAFSGEARLHGDPALLRRALYNLVENAAKYGAPPVEIAATVGEGGATITVADHGPGIPEAERDQVFLPFHRSGAASRVVRGYGVGLAFARRVIELHGGTLHADSPDEGCRMVIQLPAAGPLPPSGTA